MYEPTKTQEFYDAYGSLEWARLEASAYGRLQAIIHADFIERHVRPGDHVLDVGCGPGRFAAVIARIGATPTLVDISEEQLSLAREKLEEAGLLDQVAGRTQADVVDLSMFEEGQFDVVVCYGGPLSYVCDERVKAASELVRVTKRGGTLLVSVMSMLGALANTVRRSSAFVLQDPDRWKLWAVARSGDLPPFPSALEGRLHPGMHLYTAAELTELLDGCDTLEVAGSNVTTFEGSATFEELVADEDVWATTVELERELCRQPGLADSGSHIIMAARTR